MSDHRALKFELNIYNNQRGKGYWKMNVSIINEDEFKKNIIQIIRDTEKLEKSCVEKRETLKQKVKYFLNKLFEKPSENTETMYFEY